MNTTLAALFTVAAGGAFGGVVLGMVRETRYRIHMPGGNKMEIGFFGDALVGIAAALSIFTIAGSILNISFDKLNEPEEFIKIIALSVLAGFAGISLLQKLSENLINKVREINKDVEELKLKEKSSEFLARGEFLANNDQHDEAIEYFDLALSVDSKNELSNICKAMSLKRVGKVQEAYDLMDQIIKGGSNASGAHYNRACYGALLGHNLSSIINDLSKAIEISKWSRKGAATDSDFDSIRDAEDFKELVNKNV